MSAGATFAERAILFRCETSALIGVLAEPSSVTTERLAVLVVVGGPQYRAGSHRHFVQLSRALAAAGFPALRFDVRGMGDSEGEERDFESTADDIGVAIDALLAHTAAGTRVVLWGLCDGASAALMYLQQRRDKRVAGLCLLNPWVRSEVGQARTQVRHYYLERLQQREFWLKLLRGRVAASAVSGLARSVRLSMGGGGAADAGPASHASFQQRMADGLSRFGGQTLLVLSGDDYTAKEFIEFTRDRPEWRKLLAASTVQTRELPDADHTFSDAADKSRLAELTVDWLRSTARA